MTTPREAPPAAGAERVAPRARAYDVIVAGGRVAGASTAMLLARAGLRVLVVDPVPARRDPLSTHALMRGGVLQLHRWGLLDRIRSAGTPRIQRTTFRYGPETIGVDIRPTPGVDGLYAPRRTILDPLLAGEASASGAEVLYGWSVSDVIRNTRGRVIGAQLAGRDGTTVTARTSLLIGADGINSKVARLVGARTEVSCPHATANLYQYWTGLGRDAYRWYYEEGVAVGEIPTNDGATCVFVSLPPSRLEGVGRSARPALFRRALDAAAPGLSDRLGPPASGLRCFLGAPGHLRRASGPGWALVGDAGYFKDPLTAHGITDAFRDAELLARAVMRGGDSELMRYHTSRDELSRGLLRVTDRIASFDWDLNELKQLHLDLNREMKAEVRFLSEMDAVESTFGASTSESALHSPGAPAVVPGPMAKILC